MRSLLNDFKSFLLKGNLITLAVAFIIGAALTALVSAFVADIITPIIAAIFGKQDFSSLTFTINHSTFTYGSFINALITFITTAAAVFFFVVKPYEMATKMRPKDPTTKSCPECTTSIPLAATRCPQCTAVLPARAATA